MLFNDSVPRLRLVVLSDKDQKDTVNMMGSNVKGNVCQPMKKVPPKKPPRLHIRRYVKKIQKIS
jgi:hypothetical protein